MKRKLKPETQIKRLMRRYIRCQGTMTDHMKILAKVRGIRQKLSGSGREAANA